MRTWRSSFRPLPSKKSISRDVTIPTKRSKNEGYEVETWMSDNPIVKSIKAPNSDRSLTSHPAVLRDGNSAESMVLLAQEDILHGITRAENVGIQHKAVLVLFDQRHLLGL